MKVYQKVTMLVCLDTEEDFFKEDMEDIHDHVDSEEELEAFLDRRLCRDITDHLLALNDKHTTDWSVEKLTPVEAEVARKELNGR